MKPRHVFLMAMILLGLLGLGCNQSEPIAAVPVPPQDANAPKGMKALTVAVGQREPFTAFDIADYIATRGLPRAKSENVVVQKLEFLSAGDVSERLHGVTTGLPVRAQIGLATLQGTFIFTGPPGTHPGRFSHAYAAFDAATGNLLIVGSLK